MLAAADLVGVAAVIAALGTLLTGFAVVLTAAHTSRKVDGAVAGTEKKLDEIQEDVAVVHGLVNSDMTTMMEALLTSLRAQLASATSKMHSGTPMSRSDEEALVELPERIAALEAKLADRLRQAALVNGT